MSLVSTSDSESARPAFERLRLLFEDAELVLFLIVKKTYLFAPTSPRYEGCVNMCQSSNLYATTCNIYWLR